MEKLDLRQWLFGLLIDCPMREELADCPMNKYRNEPATKKINIAFEIEVEELKDLLLHHKKCLAEREFEIITKHLTKGGLKRYILY